MTLMFSTLLGSNAYGMTDDNSDLDIGHVHYSDKGEILSLSQSQKGAFKSSSDRDELTWSFKVWLQQLSLNKMQPVEMLFAEPYQVDNWSNFGHVWFKKVTNDRRILISDVYARVLLGYSMSQRIAFDKEKSRKQAYHALRTLILLADVCRYVSSSDEWNVLQPDESSRDMLMKIKYEDQFDLESNNWYANTWSKWNTKAKQEMDKVKFTPHDVVSSYIFQEIWLKYAEHVVVQY